MTGRGDVDDALARTGVVRGQRNALPTAVAFDHITTALYDQKQSNQEAGWVRFTSATRRESGSDLNRR